MFKTDFVYTDRATKAKYIYLKYGSLLKGKILDVCADQCYLKEYLEANIRYTGIGLHSDKLDLEIDLEKSKLPYGDNSFDVVLCFDGLEHLENIHDMFDELCRISRGYVLISLPNPYHAFFYYLKHGDYSRGQHMKFYGLPVEKPLDRHKWFFSSEEAERFIRYRARKNNMEIIQIDIEKSTMPFGGIKQQIFRLLFRNYRIFYNQNFYTGTLWAVLKKRM